MPSNENVVMGMSIISTTKLNGKIICRVEKNHVVYTSYVCMNVRFCVSSPYWMQFMLLSFFCLNNLFSVLILIYFIRQDCLYLFENLSCLGWVYIGILLVYSISTVSGQLACHGSLTRLFYDSLTELSTFYLIWLIEVLLCGLSI